MSNKFDDLAKGLAQSVTRRQALKKFGVGLAGMALACFGLTSRGQDKEVCRKAGQPCGEVARGGRIRVCCPGLICQYRYPKSYVSGICG